MTAAPTHGAPHSGHGFNLGEHGWVPFRGHLELPLRETLKAAHQLPGWPGGDPLAVSAIMRLLTALAYRCAEITDSETFEDAASRDRLFDPGSVDDYFDNHSDEFWLLPPTGSGHRPFYQDPSLVASGDPNLRPLKPKPISRSELSMDVAPSYVWGQQHPDPVFTPAAAARAMLVFLLYSRSGGGARHPRLSERSTVFQAGNLRRKVSLHPVGETLEDTLRLHFIDPEPVSGLLPGGVGSPSWELPSVPVTEPLAAPRTILESLTGRWEKTVLLVSDGTDGLVTMAACASGRLRDKSNPPLEHDPYAVRWDAKTDNSAEGPQAPYMYLRGSAEKAAWRDLDNYRARSGESSNQTIVTRYHQDHPAAGRIRVWVAVSHQQGQQVAKDVLKLVSLIPASLVVDFDAGNRATAMIDDAESIGRCLGGALRGFYKDIGHSATTGGDASGFVKRHMPAYWDRMERLFVSTVTEDHQPLEVLDAARGVYDAAVGSFGQRLAVYKRSPDKAPGQDSEPVAVTAARWRSAIKFPKSKTNETAKDQR